MASVCIVAPSSLRYMPYLRYYEDILAEAGVSYEILLWDRFGTDEVHPSASAYRRAGTARGIALLAAYAGYRQFLLRHLRSRPYEFFIVLGTQVGVLLYDYLRTRPFLLDIRDYSHEGLVGYRALSFDLVRRAAMVCISSRGFLEWLPRGVEYVVSHNLSRSHLAWMAAPFDRTRKVLSYIGAVGYYDANVSFLEGARGQHGWDVRYIGRGTCDARLETYCRSRGISNVTFWGSFVPEEKLGFYDAANFVLGIYGNDSPIGRTLTPNRLYESCLRRRPIVVNEGTYLADLVREKGLGVVLDLKERSRWGSALDWYYESEHYEEYAAKCSLFMEGVERDMAAFDQSLRSVLAEHGDLGRAAKNPAS